jgi:hypothetical protein
MRRTIPDGNWQLLGHFGVDAGMVWIGDPCYILHPDKMPKAVGSNWGDFCELCHDKSNPKALTNNNFQSFPFDLGHEGLGVVAYTGYGDGSYPVYGLIEDDRVHAIIIDFMGLFDDNESEDDPE